MNKINKKIKDWMQVGNSLNKLIEKDLPAKVAYKLSKLAYKLNEELKIVENQRVALVKKFGKETKDGNINVLPEKLDEFSQEWNSIIENEIIIETESISLNDFGDIKFTAAELMYMLDFISE